MATSGVTVLEMSRDSIINAALRKIGVIGEGTTANPEQTSTGAEALNTLVQLFATLGMPLWKRTELAIPMVVGQRDYTIGVGRTIDVPFPMKISEATFEYTGSGSQQDVEIKASYDFNLLPSNSQGTVVSIKYQPFINYGVVSVWPKPSTATGTLTITYQAPYDVFTASGDTPDFPQEWQNALIYNLALLLADEYALPLPDKQWIEKQATKHLSQALDFGTEEGSLFFSPSTNG